MTMDRAINAWEATPTAEATPELVGQGHPATLGGTAIVALRTGMLVALAAVAILVLLPAALAAQAALPG